MSEYQYYEFRAVDRRLTEQEMAELRKLSTRAEITPTSFQNEYNYGNFRGDPLELMRKYFDAFVYVANWGSRQLMLRLPISLLPSEVAQPYLYEEGLEVRLDGENIILAFSVQELEVDWEQGEGWLDALLPLRDELAGGDLRALYIGWLSTLWTGDLDDEEAAEHEPPLPPGLRKLTAAQRKLVEFLQVDEDLVAAAAEQSPPLEEQTGSSQQREEWVRRLPADYKDALLLQMLAGGSWEAHAALARRFREERSRSPAPTAGESRTVGELVAASEEQRKRRTREEKERAARERERLAREAAAKREQYLQNLTRTQEAAWLEIESLLPARTGRNYERAATLVHDLRDVAAREEKSAEFDERLQRLHQRHAEKAAFIRRLEKL
jgi:hypothetical protein